MYIYIHINVLCVSLPSNGIVHTLNFLTKSKHNIYTVYIYNYMGYEWKQTIVYKSTYIYIYIYIYMYILWILMAYASASSMATQIDQPSSPKCGHLHRVLTGQLLRPFSGENPGENPRKTHG